MVNAAPPCEEALLPYLISPRTPLAPAQVERALDYVLALRMAGGSAIPGWADADAEGVRPPEVG